MPGDDARWMRRALSAAERVRGRTSPNPWVGAVVVPTGGPTPARPDAAHQDAAQQDAADRDVADQAEADVAEGATAPPGGPHAEVEALARAGPAARGASLYVTLEPCAHHGRTPPCVDAIVAAGVRRVVVGLADPDPQVDGRGVAALRDAGVEVQVGTGDPATDAEVAEQLAPYVAHRRTGRPWVVLKLATTLDGRIAAPDGSSRWITGEAARLDAHRLRARSDAVVVGAGTVRVDDPRLTVRLPVGDPLARAGDDATDQPVRVVLGRAPASAAARPLVEMTGDLGDILDELGRRGMVQVLVEGGARTAHAFHQAGLVDRYVFYLAPALFGGDNARGAFAGPGAPSMADLWRGEVRSVTTLGGDLRVELAPSTVRGTGGARGTVG